MPRTAFVRGETIPLDVEIVNESKGVINKVTGCIRLFGKARTGSWISKGIKIQSEKVEEGPVDSGMSPTFHMQLPWDFSGSSADGNLLPVGDLDVTKLLDVQYEIRIKVDRKGLHRNMEFAIPVKIGNANKAS